MDKKEEKQKYLFQHIIEENYDPEQFQQFMLNFKENAQDLDKWTMKEIKKVVRDFKEHVNNQQKNKSQGIRNSILQDDSKDFQINQQDRKNQDETQTQYQKIEPTQSTFQEGKNSKQRKQYRASTIIMKEDSKYLEYDYKSKHQVYSETIDCTVIPPNNLLTKDVEIKVEKFMKKQGGLFEQSYVSYLVFTPILNVRVERRYSDFEWLKKILQILHPGLPIPPIAKKGQFRRYDDKHLWKRMLILQKFLNKLMQIPQLKAQQLVQNFLKFSEKGEFEKYKATFKGATTPTNLKQLRNTKGKINLSIQPRINSFLVRAQKNLTENQPQVKKIYKQFKAAASMLQGCGQTLKGIAKTCDNLNKKDQAFRTKVQLKYCQNNIFTSLGQATVRLAQQLQKQAQTFRELFYSLLKYESLHMLNMLDYFDHLAQIQKDFQLTKSALIRRKVKLYEQGNTSKWGIPQSQIDKSDKTKTIDKILPKQTKQLQKYRQQYALHNFQMYEELNRFYSTKNYHISRYMQDYCQKETRISSQMMMIWVDMETNVMAMRENKFLQKL